MKPVKILYIALMASSMVFTPCELLSEYGGGWDWSFFVRDVLHAAPITSYLAAMTVSGCYALQNH